MKTFRITRAAAMCTAIALATIAIAHAQRVADKPRRIAIFGSAVADGTGDEVAREGYTAAAITHSAWPRDSRRSGRQKRTCAIGCRSTPLT